MKEETKELLIQRQVARKKLGAIRKECYNLTRQICTLEGKCPICHRWHYAHCRGEE